MKGYNVKPIILTMLVALVLSPSAKADELFSDVEKAEMMQLTLKHFWGKAIDSKGDPVQPADEKERTTVPISKQQAHYLINKGGESGLAQWCGVDWQERYLLMLQQLRMHMKNDKQTAYSGVLHGVAQQTLAASLKGEPCDRDTSKQVATLMKQDIENLKRSLKAQ